jgi:hypothetical protein
LAASVRSADESRERGSTETDIARVADQLKVAFEAEGLI